MIQYEPTLFPPFSPSLHTFPRRRQIIIWIEKSIQTSTHLNINGKRGNFIFYPANKNPPR